MSGFFGGMDRFKARLDSLDYRSSQRFFVSGDVSKKRAI
jgi:hypothetical protein